MSNSPLVDVVVLSPNYNPRNASIKKITIHHMAGNLTVETCGNVFAPTSRQASSNYGVGSDGRVGMYVEEYNRAWTSASPSNDHQAITIEVANDEYGGNWHVSDVALAATIDLCVDICKRNGIKSLNYTGDANGNLTRHDMFANTNCPGPYLGSKFPYIAEQVNARLNGSTPSPKPTPTPTPSGEKYAVGLPVCTNTLSSQASGGNVYKGDWSAIIEKVFAGSPYPYRLIKNGTLIGFTNDNGIDTDPHTPGGVAPAPTPKPTAKKLYLPASATSWNVYPANVAPVVGNQCGRLNPSLFGGLTYDILAYPQTDVVTISTRDFGRVNIYVAASTGAVIK